MARDDEAIRRSRAQAVDHVIAEQWVGGDPAKMAAERAHYVEHGWRPDGPKTLYRRGETPREPQ